MHKHTSILASAMATCEHLDREFEVIERHGEAMLTLLNSVAYYWPAHRTVSVPGFEMFLFRFFEPIGAEKFEEMKSDIARHFSHDVRACLDKSNIEVKVYLPKHATVNKLDRD